MKARDVLRLMGAAALMAVAILALPAAASAAPPTLTLDDPTNSIVTAHLSGEVEVPADGFETYWCLEYAEEGVENWSGFCYQGPVQPGETASVETDIGGLKAETSYEARLSALNFNDSIEEHTAAKTFTTDSAVAPSLTIEPAADVGAHGAHLSGTIDPEGGNEDAVAGLLPIAWELQVDKDGEGWNTVGSGELSGTDAESNSPVAVEADAAGLIPNSHYQSRLVAHYAGLETISPEAEFDTEALAPDVERETLWEPTATSIQLNALVNPHNSELTDCHFEWGEGSNLDHTTPCELGYEPYPAEKAFIPAWYEADSYTPPHGEGFTMVGVRLSGLEPTTEYSFRLIASNATGTGAETVRNFETLQEVEPPTACPNAAIRHQQHADLLPDCRAYEMATPVEKGGGDISAAAKSLTTVASINGEALAFNSRSPFGDTLGSGNGGHTTYVARRSPSGWSSRGVTPMADPEDNQTGFGSTRTQLFADDLSSLTVWAYDLPGVVGDTPKRDNIYAEDTRTRELQPVTPLPESTPPVNQFATFPVSWGQSSDGRHIAFEALTKYLPDAREGMPNVYQWDKGELSLVGRLPDGTVPLGGSRTMPGPPSSLHTMSVDGSRELFYASDGGPARQLYQRIDGTRTVWISEPEGADQSEPTSVELQAASPDGHTVLFTTVSPLTDEDENQEDDLYRWTDGPDPAGEDNLKLISRFVSGGSPPDEIVGMSDDGKRVYLTSNLTAEVWDEGETRKFNGIEPVPGSGLVETGEKYGVLGEAPGRARVTASGRYLAFLSSEGFRGPAPTAPGVYGGNGDNRMYLYDFRNDSLRCVSCADDGVDFGALVVPLGSVTTNDVYNSGFRPRFLVADGRVFFSTAASLVAADVNGVSDTYQYDPRTGSVTLLSSGRGQDSMTFADASSSGDDVFIATRQRLASPDSDDLVDVYDVRSDGGFPEPEPALGSPCEGETCQPGSAGGALAVGAATAVTGRGNVIPHKRRCSRRASRHHHVSGRRCGKHRNRHPRQHRKRTANVDGRTSK